MIRAESALTFIDAQDRKQWVEIGMALRDEHGDAAFDIFDRWSATASNYDPLAAKSAWKSFKRGGGIGIGTLFHIARLAGWKPDANYVPPTPAQLAERQRQREIRESAEGKRIQAAQSVAARKARHILSECVLEKHAYLDSHGMGDDLGLVYRPNDDDNLLAIPMRVGKDVAGVQLIDRKGNKRFLSGQRTNDAEHVIGDGKLHVYCEGFCTGMAIRKAVAALKASCSIHVCFSANNMLRMAGTGVVVADNDVSLTGEKAAKETGLPYWISEVKGEDFCDYWQRVGTLKASMELRKLLYP